MPLNKSVTFDDAGYVGYTPQDTPPTSFVSTLGAAFRQNNAVASTIANPRLDYDVHDLTKIDPSYDPYKDIKGYEDYAPLFENVYNQTAATALKQQIDQARKDKATLAQSGWTGTLLDFGAGVIDLPTLIPGGALVRGGKIGFDMLKSALAVGASAGLSSAVQETALRTNDPTRTNEDSAYAIGGQVLLGGILGAGLSKLFTHSEWSQISKSLEEDLSGEVANPNAVVEQIVRRAQAAGAQSVDDIAPTLQEMGVGGPRAAQIVANATKAARLSPGIRTMLSPSAKVREIYLKMVDNPIYTTMNMEGKTLGADVENLVKTYTRGAYGDWKRLADAEYLKYRQDLGQNMITSRLPATGDVLSKTQFLERVAQAGRRGDLDASNEFVTRVAQAAREKVFDPLFERAKAEGLLPEDAKTTTAASYVTRMWNREKLIGEEPQFKEIVRQQVQSWTEQEVKRLTDARDSRLGSLNSRISDLEMPADQRAQLMSDLTEQLRQHREGNPAFVAKDEELSNLRSELFGARKANDKKTVDLLNKKIDESANAAGKEYADYVTKRNSMQARLARVRNNIAGRAGQVEAMKARIADIEGSNIERLRRLHRSLTILDTEAERNAPDVFEEKLSKARTQFAQVMERSNKAQERLVATRDRIAEKQNAIAATKEEVVAGKDGGSKQLARDVEAGKARSVALRNEFESLSTDLDKKSADHEAYVKKQTELRDKALSKGDNAKASEIDRRLTDRSAKHDAYVKSTYDKLTSLLDEADSLKGIDHNALVDQLLQKNAARRSLLESSMKNAEERFQTAEQRRIQEMNDRAERIAELEKTDPEEALSELRDLVEERLGHASDLITREGNRIMKLAQRIGEADPELVKKQVGGLKQRIKDVEREFADRVDVGMGGQHGFKDYVEEVVSSIFNNLTGKGGGDIPEWIVPAKRGPLKERTFNIPDAKIEAYLHNDAEAILHKYARLMSADIELAKKFNGKPDMEEQMQEVSRDYEQLRAQAKTPAERLKLDQAEEKDLKHLRAFRDMLRGTYRTADRSSGWNAVTKAALTWNYMRLLGGVTLSSLTDATRLPMVHGLRATMKEALPILTNRVNGIRSIQIAKQDAKELGAVAESVMQHRLASMADLNDPYRFGNRFERYLDNTANVFTKMTGIGWWTDMMNTISAVMTENRVLKNVLSAVEVSKTPESIYHNTSYAGEIAIRHGFNKSGKRIGAPPKLERNFAGGRYDANSFGNDGVYLDASGHWTEPGPYANFGVGEFATGTAKFKNALLITPETLGKLREKINVPHRPQNVGNADQMIGEDVAKYARKNGYDGIIVTGFDGKAVKTYDDEVAMAKRFRTHESVFQDQAFAFDPQSIKFNEKTFLPGDKDIPALPGIGEHVTKTVTPAKTVQRVNYDKLDKAEKAYMAYLGIDETTAARIAEQFTKHGVTDNGIHGGNVSEWDDDIARRAFGAALNKDTDRTIVKPGMGDVPLWMKTNTGRLLTQFKSFGVASHQRVLIAGLQERPRRLMEGMVLGTAVGMMIGYLKMIERGDYERANNLLSNPGKWIGDGLDRAGIFYLPFDVSNTADKVSASLGGPNVSISSIFSRIAGDKDHSGSPTRYASRDPIGAVAGPTAGLFSDLATILAAVSRHQLSKVDSETQDITPSQEKEAINAALRQIPGSALPGIRTIINAGVKPK
jgi:hypothetical protein